MLNNKEAIKLLSMSSYLIGGRLPEYQEYAAGCCPSNLAFDNGYYASGNPRTKNRKLSENGG